MRPLTPNAITHNAHILSSAGGGGNVQSYSTRSGQVAIDFNDFRFFNSGGTLAVMPLPDARILIRLLKLAADELEPVG